jgi:hypothetical protein
MSLAHHYAERALQFRVSQNTWASERNYSKMLGKFDCMRNRHSSSRTDPYHQTSPSTFSFLDLY